MRINLGKIYVIIFNFILIILALILLAVGISVLPLPDNYRVYSVMSGSMEPIIKTGSIVFVKPVKEYKIQDVVTIKTKDPKKTVTHRIIGKKSELKYPVFETKGDANNSKDLELLLSKNIIGKVFLSIPYLGYPISYSKTLPGLIILIIIPSTIIIYGELMNIKNESIRLIKESKKRKLTTKEKIEEKIGEEIIEVEKEIKQVEKKIGDKIHEI